jgi:hypothetical protein
MVPYYLSRRGHAVRFIDTLGLVDREVASHYRIGAKLLDLGRRIASGASARDALAEGRRERARRVAESILARQPDYILLETELESNGMLEELAGNPRFRGDYTLVAALPVAAAPRVRIFARAAAALRAGISPAS